jgi:opacity protein-like surface antigen
MRATQLVVAGFAAVSVGLFNQTALAADAAPVRPVVVVAPTPWHGVYLGVGGGYAWSRLREFEATIDYVGAPPPGTTDPATFFGGINSDGGFGTAIIGGDIQRGAHVFGIFADYDAYHEFDGSLNSPPPPCPTGATCPPTALPTGFARTFGVQFDSMTTVAGRFGFAWSPVSLLYGLAGWSWVKGSLNALETCSPDACPGGNLQFSAPYASNGWTVGFGMERLFHNDRWSLRLEYRYTDLNNDTASGTCTVCTPDRTATINSGDGFIQSLRAVVALRLGIPRRL